MDLLADIFRELYAKTGINFPVFYDAFDRTQFFGGLLITVELSLLGIFMSLVLGSAGAYLHIRSPLLRRFVINPFVQLFRNTPPLIQLFFFYFGVGSLLPKLGTGAMARPVLEGFGWTLIALTLYTTAFNIESLRSGCGAVPVTMIDAAESLGYTRGQVFRHIVLPLGFRNAIPALTNNLVELVKTSALGYVIGVPEVLYVASQVWADELNIVEMMCLLFACYTILIAVVVAVMHVLERRLRMPGYSV